MKSLWQKLHIISDKLHLPSLPNWLVGILALIFILRIPSFFEPYYYGDEMVYLTLGQGIRQGLTLYKDIHDNKPPLLYITAAVAGNLFWFKVILAFWNLVTIVVFYKLAKILFEKNLKTQKIATLLFGLLTTIPLLEGLTVNSELFMIVFTIAAFLILLGKNLTSKKIFFAGILFGLGTLYKVPAAFDAPIIVFYWFITAGFSEWKKILKNTSILIAGFAVPLLLTFIWYFFKGALSQYVTAAFLQNVGYLSSFRPGDIQKPFLVRNAPLLIRGGILLLGSAILFLFRKKLSKRFILFSLWTLFALFAITLSERPYPHYFIQAVAPISFLLATFFTEKSLEQSLTVIPLALAFFVPFYYQFWYYPTASYYLRFINFALRRETKMQYFASFSGTVNRDYEIAQFLVMSGNTADRVFMWDPDSAAVYALSKRLPPIKYVVDYHITDYSSKTAEAKNIAANPPKFIILTSNNPYLELLPLIRQRYILVNRIGDADIYSRLDFAQAK
jgi:4-amino-4-deoxy-L-arabinose transferase-like glycosyltransferase